MRDINTKSGREHSVGTVSTARVCVGSCMNGGCGCGWEGVCDTGDDGELMRLRLRIWAMNGNN